MPKKIYDLNDQQEWSDMFSDTKDAAYDLQQSVKKRNMELQKPTKSNQNLIKSNAKLRREIRYIQNSVSKLRKMLPKLKKQISTNEIQSRRDNLDELSEFIEDIHSIFINPPSKKKNTLIGDNSNQNYLYQNNSEDDPFKDTSDLDVLEYQDRMMKVQDQNLDVLSGELDKTAQLGKDIGEVLDEHHHLLNNLDNEITDASKGLKKNIKRINVMLKKARLPCAIFVIIFLILVIVILLIIAIALNV